MQDIIYFLKKCFDVVINALSSIVSFFVDFFKSLGDVLYDSLAFFFLKLRENLYDIVFESITDVVEGALGHGSGFWVSEIYDTINFFVPLDFLFSTLIILLNVWLSVFIAKILLKITPTIY